MKRNYSSDETIFNLNGYVNRPDINEEFVNHNQTNYIYVSFSRLFKGKDEYIDFKKRIIEP